MKSFKNALCFLLIAATLLAYMPAVAFQTEAANVSQPFDAETVRQRLETIKAGKYGVGKYFTENGKACTSHPSSNCHKATAAEAGTEGCTQCFGFARYVFYQLFGKSLSTYYWNARKYELGDLTNITVIGQSTSADANAWKSILSQALPGDVIQRSKTSTSGQHTMIIESVDATGVQILDCNGTASLCMIDSRKLTWSDLAAKGSYFTLYRAKNYPMENDDSLATQPSDLETIRQRLETIKAGKYGVGKYFTENGKACTSHPSSNCHKATAAEAGTEGCTQCFGFARYVFYQLFGKSLSTYYWNARKYELGDLTNITVIGQSTSADANAWKSILSQALPGDVIQRSKTSTSGQHTMIIESVDATGVQILDCNGTASLCKIDSRKLSWNDLAAKGSYFTLYRAKNYPLPELTIRFRANGGSISSSLYYKLVDDTVVRKNTDEPFEQIWQYGVTSKSGLVAASAMDVRRDGYTFLGWRRSTSSGTVFKHKDTAVLAEQICPELRSGDCTITLYAAWRPNTYTVFYDANGGTGTTSSSVHTYDKAMPFTANGFQKAGYVFAGWSTDKHAVTATYTDKQSIKNLLDTDGASITLYAVWVKAKITSSVYIIDNSEKLVSGFDERTTTADFLAQLKPASGLVLLKNGSTCTEQFAGTGLTVEYRINGVTVDALTLVLTGDVNGDGRITASDYLQAKRAILKLSPLSGVYEKAGDYNKSGDLTAVDYILLKRRVLFGK